MAKPIQLGTTNADRDPLGGSFHPLMTTATTNDDDDADALPIALPGKAVRSHWTDPKPVPAASTVVRSEGDFPLHRAAYNGDIELVKHLLKRVDLEVNGQDHQGNTAMHLAVQCGHIEVVQLLIAAKTDATVRNQQLWNCRAEAAYGGTLDMMKAVLVGDRFAMHRRFCERLPALAAGMKQIPDFTMAIKWRLRSIIPFLSHFAPSDTYKLYKRDTMLRVDLTMVNITDSMRVERGRHTYILDTVNAECVWMIDHDQRQYCNVVEWMTQANDIDISCAANKMMRRNTMQIDINTRNCQVVPQTKLMGSAPKETKGLCSH